MKGLKLLLILFLLMCITAPAFASTYTISFDKDDNTGIPMPASLFPSGEFLDANGQLQFVERSSYIEHGFEHNAIVFSNQQDGSHLHATANIDAGAGTSSTASNLSADAGGGFFKQTNGESFSLESWDFVRLSTMVENERHDLRPDLFDPAPESHLVIQGSLAGVTQFNLDVFDTSPFLSTREDSRGNLVGFGLLDFLTETNGASANIDLVEYWFSGTGRGVIPLNEHLGLDVALDNVVVTSVPIPAAFYLFFSGLVGVAGISKKLSKST
jgi:hypothetical protein